MIIKNNFNKNNSQINYLEQEKEGIRKAVAKWEERFKKNEIDREKFLKQKQEFAKRQKELSKKINKLK